MVCLLTIGLPIRAIAESSCNPLVSLTNSDTQLLSTLTRFADQYSFNLTMPASLDRPIKPKKPMPLDKLIRNLTKDLNTVLKHKKQADCEVPVLSHLIILPVGNEAESTLIIQSSPEQTEDYIYIDDMTAYVGNVLDGKQVAELNRMTPEQREEFTILKDSMIEQRESSEEPETDPRDIVPNDIAVDSINQN